MRTKYNQYIKWIKAHKQDKHGFIDTEYCDSLLWTSLVCCSPDLSANIPAAFDKATGQWHRRPLDKPCYPDHTKSTISRDMLVGLLYWVWQNDRKDIATQIVWYALRHFGFMGQAIDIKTWWGRCQIGPGLLSTYALLSGKWYFWPLTLIPADIKIPGALPVDYGAHIQVLHVLLRCLASNTDPRKNSIIQAQQKRQPHNPLFNIAAGNWDAALKLMNSDQYWPSDRLPDSTDRWTSWLQQRDFGRDWQPGRKGHQHHGGDYVFLVWLHAILRGRYR